MRAKTAAELAQIANELAQKLMTDKCIDKEMLTLVDRILRRVFHDIHPGWIRWSFYVATHIFEGDHDKCEAWARENCK